VKKRREYNDTLTAAKPQLDPMPGITTIYPLVIKDIEERVVMGITRYGTPLKSQNGRDALWDAYVEAIDLVMYLRQELEERKEDNNVTTTR
jgi:hypothetical protein